MSKAQILASASKLQRKQDRRQLGSLENLLVTPTTQKRYESALHTFFKWATDEKRSIPNETVHFDLLVSEYLNHLWEEGEGRALGSNTLAALQFKCPHLRKNLPSSWRLLSAWHKKELPMRAPPLTVPLLYSLCGVAMESSQPSFAVAMMVGFYSLLRTGEIAKIQAKDVTINAKATQAVINLGLTKGGSRQGALEHVVLDFPPAVKMLQACLLNSQPGDYLLPNIIHFRAAFKLYTDKLGLKEWSFKPYSLRRGGATHHFREHGLLSQTILKGRWLSSKSARIYINDGLATLATLKFEHNVSLLTRYEKLFKRKTAAAWDA